jgi:O-methyltransferase
MATDIRVNRRRPGTFTSVASIMPRGLRERVTWLGLMEGAVTGPVGGDEGRFVGFANDDLVIGAFPEHDPQYVDFSAADVATVHAVWRYTVTSPERVYALIRAVEYLVADELVGDIVECGVWRGGSMMAVARTLLAMECKDRILWLYDTFAGMTRPGPRDVAFDGVPAQAEFGRRRISDESSTWATASLSDVHSNLVGTGYPETNIRFIQGPVERTLPAAIPDRIALLRLDTDWYESTLHELEYLYPRLIAGGVLIIDDYGHWRGARQATDEYLSRLGKRPLLHRIDYSGRLLVKP